MCDTEELAELTQALMTIGQMMGALIFPSLSGMYTVNEPFHVAPEYRCSYKRFRPAFDRLSSLERAHVQSVAIYIS